MNTIILAAGNLNHRLLPMGTHQSNATLPVNGKSVIAWVLDDLLEKGIESVTVVIRSDNRRLSELLHVCYAHKLALNLVELEQSESIVESLQMGLATLHFNAVDLAKNMFTKLSKFSKRRPDLIAKLTHSPTRVILGDTLVRDDFQNKAGDFVFTSPVSVSDIWCVAEIGADGNITGYQDKQQLPGDAFEAVVGYYQFSDTPLLQSAVLKAKTAHKTQLSDVLSEYAAIRPIRAERVSEWFDFGHIDSFIRSKKSLLRPRHFNFMGINPLLNTISKESDWDEKLRNELAWYDGLPAELRVLTPRIVQREERGSNLYFEQEYYGYPTLAELYLYAELDLDTWRNIVRHLLDIQQIFREYASPASPEDCREIYWNKTLERIEQLTTRDPTWAALFQQEHIEWNGKQLANWPLLKTQVSAIIPGLCNCPAFGILHGDCCFSNILYDPASQIARFIDPRGSFGKPGLYGDPRYDLAKLRHSIAGSYDYIVADLFRLEQAGRSFQTAVFQNPVKDDLTHFFDREVEFLGYQIADIRLIEALLFFSMLPLHSDHPARQKMMYLRGLQLLNEL